MKEHSRREGFLQVRGDLLEYFRVQSVEPGGRQEVTDLVDGDPEVEA
jgi:hypothetical protein